MIIGATLLLAGCRAQGRTLPFETIVKSIHSRYAGLDMRLIVATDPTDVPLLPGLPEEARRAVEAVDYRADLVIALYRGQICSAGVGINRITHDGVVTVRVEAAVQTLVLYDLVCFPYHIVRLKKPEAMGDRLVRFVLVDQGEEVIKQQYYITPLR